MIGRLVEGLYVDAMLLADEARGVFERGHEPPLPGTDAVAWSCESLKITTRLMHCIAWLLSRKAAARGEDMGRRAFDLGRCEPPDAAILAVVSAEARQLAVASEELYQRVRRLADRNGPVMGDFDGARRLHQLVRQAL